MLTFIILSRARFFIAYKGGFFYLQASGASELITSLPIYHYLSLYIPLFPSIYLSLPLYTSISLSLPISPYISISIPLSPFFSIYLLICVTLDALPSPDPSPPLSLSTHPVSLSLSPSPLRRFRCCRRICKPWPPTSPPPSFALAISATPHTLLSQHLQPRYEIMHGFPVGNGGEPRRCQSPSLLSTSSTIAVAIANVFRMAGLSVAYVAYVENPPPVD